MTDSDQQLDSATLFTGPHVIDFYETVSVTSSASSTTEQTDTDSDTGSPHSGNNINMTCMSINGVNSSKIASDGTPVTDPEIYHKNILRNRHAQGTAHSVPGDYNTIMHGDGSGSDEELLQGSHSQPNIDDNGIGKSEETESESELPPRGTEGTDDNEPLLQDDTLPQRRHRRPKPRFPCIRSCLDNSTGMDMLQLLLHVTAFVFGIGCLTVLLLGKLEVQGHCLFASTYGQEGAVEHTVHSVYCAGPLYCLLVSCMLAFTFMAVNWIALFRPNVKWVLAQMILTVFGLIAVLLAFGLLILGFMQWCDHMQHMRTNSCQPGDKGCIDTSKAIAKSCTAAAKYMDTFEEDDDGNSISRQMTFYRYALASLIMYGIAIILWIVQSIATAIWLHRISIETKERQMKEQQQRERHLQQKEEEMKETEEATQRYERRQAQERIDAATEEIETLDSGRTTVLQSQIQKQRRTEQRLPDIIQEADAGDIDDDQTPLLPNQEQIQHTAQVYHANNSVPVQ